MVEPILTICIPTYNRCYRLKRLLETICYEIKKNKLEEEVNVMISDNSSADETNQICIELIKYNSFVSYHRFVKNCGFDGNYEYLFSHAPSNYIQIMSDDDFYIPNSLIEIVNFLKLHNDLNACFMNNVSFKNEYETIDKCFKKFLNIEEDVILNKDAFVKTIGLSFSFISSLILNKKFFDGRDLKKYFGTMWMGSYAFLACSTNDNNKYGIIAKPIIAYHETSGLFWYDFYSVFGPNKKDVINSLIREGNFSKKLLKRLYRKSCYPVISVISKERILRRKKLLSRFKPFFSVTWMYPEMWLIYITLLFPRFLWIFIRRLLKKNLSFDS